MKYLLLNEETQVIGRHDSDQVLRDRAAQYTLSTGKTFEIYEKVERVSSVREVVLERLT